jgi:hypothetical protein
MMQTASLPKLDSDAVKANVQAYNPDQQLKYLHLEAEVEMLIQQLQTLKSRQSVGAACDR